jgi:hypothetical protein
MGQTYAKRRNKISSYAARVKALSRWLWNPPVLTSVTWFAVAALIVWANPLHDSLDLAAIAGIAGLIVVILSVTASVVLLLTQHLSEHYPRVLLLEVRSLAPWARPLGSQVFSVIFVVAAGVLQPTRSTALAALVLLVMVLVQTSESFSRLLDIFDASALTTQIGGRWLKRFNLHGATAANLKLAADPLLGLAESASITNDPVVVEASLSALAKVIGLYVSHNMTATWGDGALQGVLNRLSELPRRAAGSLPVTVLPAVAEGIGAIGCATGERASAFAQDSDDVTPRLMQMLQEIAATSARHPNSTAPWDASMAMFRVALAAIQSGKLATGSYAIKLAGGLIRGAPPRGEHLTGPCLFGLLQVAFEYTRNGDGLMAGEYASEVIQLFRSIHESSPQVSLRQLVLPLESTNLATLHLALLDAAERQGASKRRRDRTKTWEALAEACWLLCLEMARQPGVQEIMVGNDASECAALGLIGDLRRAPDLATYGQRFNRCWKALAAHVRDTSGTAASSWETFTELMLTTYVTSETRPARAKELRSLIFDWLTDISATDSGIDYAAAATARLVGAAAIGRDDLEMAQRVVNAVGPPPDRGDINALYVPEEDLFTAGHFGPSLFITPVRRGIEPMDLGTAHDSIENRRRFLELEPEPPD